MDLKILLDTPPWEWPRNAEKVLHQALTNPQTDEADRLIGAELAGDLVVMNDQLAGDLLSILGNPRETEDLRAQAAISLGPVLEQTDTDIDLDPEEDLPITKRTFGNIQESLRKAYLDTGVPTLVRRRVLEAAVRAPQDWQKDAIRAAWSSGERDWILTAVFCMRYIRGFDNDILAALKSADPEIHYEAVNAADTWELKAAWPHVHALITDAGTEKSLLLAAISAAASIRPQEAHDILVDLAASDDEEIADAADEALSMMDGGRDEDDDESEWIN